MADNSKPKRPSYGLHHVVWDLLMRCFLCRCPFRVTTIVIENKVENFQENIQAREQRSSPWTAVPQTNKVTNRLGQLRESCLRNSARYCTVWPLRLALEAFTPEQLFIRTQTTEKVQSNVSTILCHHLANTRTTQHSAFSNPFYTVQQLF